MKILAINGSHRGGNGFTSFLLEKIKSGAARAGVQFETNNLADYKISRCIACSKCQSAGHLKKCIFDGKDDVATIMGRIEDADVLILASPVYVFNISSLLKTLLERYYSSGTSNKLEVTRSGLMFHEVNDRLKNKKFLGLIVSNNMEEATTEASEVFFRNFARFMDLDYLGTIKRPNGKLVSYGKDAGKEEQYPLIKGVYQELEKIGFEIASGNRIKRSSIAKASRLILPVPFLRQLLRITFIKRKIAAKAANRYFS